ncbi:hypothetical protein CC80DRAFT_517514 [Byssothecium circinans]|uniref:Uncharacterized protein n=1 Tax=Byssothecium circinans TaxID=147558 RepID=A0A6A5TRL6_9PLEO|nr:hypothetical protein CC80DRAFT_517514 [Byssothecium circinans]
MGIGASLTHRLAREVATLILKPHKEARVFTTVVDVTLNIEDVITITGTNVNSVLFTTYAGLNEGGIKERGRGTILNVTGTTALEAFQEGFTNALRTEIVGTNIKVLALRPGVS